MAYSRAEISFNDGMKNKADVYIELSLEEKANQQWQLSGKIESDGKVSKKVQEYTINSVTGIQDKELKIEIKKFCLQLLRKHKESSITSYGILTGVRPVKIVHRLLDKSWDGEQVVQCLREEFLVDEAKANLLLKVARNNRRYIPEPESAAQTVSIYIGIPYCPSRCYYCSFPGAVLGHYEKEMKPFINSLLQELNGIGDYIQEAGLKVQTIYVGGGTPTVLTVEDLKKIFDLLEKKFNSHQTEEITVEAGRPETLTLDKLKLMKSAGVSRICINPQTMNNSTLKLIGRRHDKEQVIQAVESARKEGIRHINMDLIIGLPGESLKEHKDTLEQILKLKPENITVHTLALKRGSIMAQDTKDKNIFAGAEEVEQSLAYIYDRLQNWGYLPYYLYRQKYMQSNMENIGYSLAGSFCIYNILMIEEQQTIIGIGGGAGSKIICPGDRKIQSIYNPKNPEAYCTSVERLVKGKVDNLRALN
jgi:oxygen-independent coproporphyrinogen-3 oxidase